MPKIVEFTEDSSMESTSNDSAGGNMSEPVEEEKHLIIRFRKIESKGKKTPPDTCFMCLSSFPSEAKRDVSPSTVYPMSSDSKTIEENRIISGDDKVNEEEKIESHIQEVRKMMDNLESMLESHACNDQSSVTSDRSMYNENNVEMVVENEEFEGDLFSSGEEQISKYQQWGTQDAQIAWREKSYSSVDNNAGVADNTSIYSLVKQRVSNKQHSSCSLSNRWRSREQYHVRFPPEDNVIIPCVAHSCIQRRSRSGSNIRDAHCAFKKLVPEFHAINADCVCQMNRDEFL